MLTLVEDLDARLLVRPELLVVERALEMLVAVVRNVPVRVQPRERHRHLHHPRATLVLLRRPAALHLHPPLAPASARAAPRRG